MASQIVASSIFNFFVPLNRMDLFVSFLIDSYLILERQKYIFQSYCIESQRDTKLSNGVWELFATDQRMTLQSLHPVVSGKECIGFQTMFSVVFVLFSNLLVHILRT